MKSYFRFRHIRMSHNFRTIWNRYRYLLFFGIGMCVGIINLMLIVKLKGLDANNFLSSMHMIVYDETYRNLFLLGNFNHMKLWKNVLCTRGEEFLILIMLGFTKTFPVLISIFLMILGFLIGGLLESAFMFYGGMGILIFLFSIFPQYIMYIAAVILMIRFFQKKEYTWKNTAAIVMIILMIIFLGTVLESFVNPYIQRWFLYQIRNFI